MQQADAFPGKYRIIYKQPSYPISFDTFQHHVGVFLQVWNCHCQPYEHILLSSPVHIVCTQDYFVLSLCVLGFKKCRKDSKSQNSLSCSLVKDFSDISFPRYYSLHSVKVAFLEQCIKSIRLRNPEKKNIGSTPPKNNRRKDG